jgi:hypothetical protein
MGQYHQDLVSVHDPVSVQMDFVELRIAVAELQFDLALHLATTAANFGNPIFNAFGQADLGAMLIARYTDDGLAGRFAKRLSMSISNSISVKIGS